MAYAISEISSVAASVVTITIFTARCSAERGNVMVSRRPSVTLVYPDHIVLIVWK